MVNVDETALFARVDMFWTEWASTQDSGGQIVGPLFTP